MNIKILGACGYDCLRIELMVLEALADLDLDATIERVYDAREINKYRIESVPGVVINGAVVAAAQMPTVAQLKAWLSRAALPKAA